MTIPEEQPRICVGPDYEQKHRDYKYLAYVSTNHNHDASGSTKQEAVTNLHMKYPYTAGLDVIE